MFYRNTCRQLFGWILLILLQIQNLFGEEDFEALPSSYPVEISFLIADLKIDRKGSPKICEIQNGSLSSFKGECFSNGGISRIVEKLLQILDSFHLSCWVKLDDVCDKTMKHLFHLSPDWNKFNNFATLSCDPAFIQQGGQAVYDPNSLSNYRSLIFSRVGYVNDADTFAQKFPSAIIMDRATIPYWVDKYKMSWLLKGDPLLEEHKPKWALYQSAYFEDLAKGIIREIGGEIFVIKPRGEFLGTGVIIASKDELDATLKYILTGNLDPGLTLDASHEFWLKKRPTTFLVEEFIEADPIIVPHLEGKLYSPTLRIAFLLIYQNREVHIKFLGGFYFLPKKPITEPGSLNEKYKSCCHPPHYSKISFAELKRVEEQLKNALLAFYRKMLHNNQSQNQDSSLYECKDRDSPS